MIKRVKLETIYKMAKEDNEKIKERKLFPDGWDEKVYDYYNKLSKESSDVEMFMEFLGGEDSPLEMAYAYRRNMYIMLYTMNATDTIAFVDGEYDIFYIVSKDGDDYNSWEWCFTNNIDPIKYRGDDGDEPVPEWLIKKYGEKELLNEISGMDDNAKPVAVIFNLGVNDLIHKNRESISYDSVASDYASYMNGLSRKLTARNCELFYMSVNPCNTAMKSTRKESEIRGFNNRLRQRLNGNFTWINSYSYLMRCGYTTRCEFRGYTDDGVHYSMRTYKRIYAYAIKQIR